MYCYIFRRILNRKQEDIKRRENIQVLPLKLEAGQTADNKHIKDVQKYRQ